MRGHMREIRAHLLAIEPQLEEAKREEKEVHYVYHQTRRYIAMLLSAALDAAPENELPAYTFIIHQVLEDYQAKLQIAAPDPATEPERYEEFRRRTHSLFVNVLGHHTWHVDADHSCDGNWASLR